MNQVESLIEKHRANGLLIDTNILLVLLVGRTNRQRIPECKRTQSYTAADYDLLERLVGQFKTVITTPHLLTEVSNLDPLSGKERAKFQNLYRQWVVSAKEFYDESRSLVVETVFDRLGLADAAITFVARKGMLVLTDDAPLYGMLSARGIDAINFNHIRTLVW
jgi:hypothetical protein